MSHDRNWANNSEPCNDNEIHFQFIIETSRRIWWRRNSDGYAISKLYSWVWSMWAGWYESYWWISIPPVILELNKNTPNKLLRRVYLWTKPYLLYSKTLIRLVFSSNQYQCENSKECSIERCGWRRSFRELIRWSTASWCTWNSWTSRLMFWIMC